MADVQEHHVSILDAEGDGLEARAGVLGERRENVPDLPRAGRGC
jgi:hypothetical protein